MTMAGKMTAAHRPLRRHISAVPSVPVPRLIEPWAGHYDEVHAVGSIREGLPAIRDVTSLPNSRSPLPMILASLLSRVANAGQSQPLLYKDGRCQKIELTGFPLGIFEEVSYDEWTGILEPGDILVFHSDGIAESANAEGQFFGNEKLRKLIEQHHELQAADLADLILREVDWFTQSAPLSDDRTLVVAKVR